MDETLRKEIFERLDQIVGAVASKTGAAAEHFWPLAVRQEIVEGAARAGLMVASVAACAFLWWLTVRNYKAYKGRDWTDEPHILGLGIASGFLTLVTGAASMCCFIPMLTELFNPEYAALRAMIGLLTGAQG